MAKVQTEHPDFTGNLALWGRCRDFTAGSEAVKAAGETYLPKLGGQDNAAYEKYLARAQLFNATGRTVDGMTGLIMRIDPPYQLPPQLAELESDIDYAGTGIFEFAKLLVRENMTLGRGGILVDFPQRPEDIVTQAQAEATGLRPYLAHYAAEKIVNWRTARVNGATVLTLLVLQEELDSIDEADEFVTTSAVQYRVLDLDEGARYRQRLFRAPDGGGEYEQYGNDILPLKAGARMAAIPFVFLGAETNSPEVQKPPIADLVEVNLGHFKNSADYEHGLHFTGLPTPVITGHNVAEGESIAIGSESFLVLNKPEAKAFFMEFSGSGLGALQEAMGAKERQMAVLGARMLQEEKKGVESADAAAIHRSGEGGVLASLAGSVAKGMRRALRLAADWAGGNPDAVEFDLNRDFLPGTMPPAMLQQLLAAWQSGAISHAVLFDNLKRGEVVRDDITLEEMQDEIEAQGPAGMPSGQETGDSGAE